MSSIAQRALTLLVSAVILGPLAPAAGALQADEAWPDGFSHVVVDTAGVLGLSSPFVPDNEGGLLLDVDADGRLDLILRENLPDGGRALVLLSNLGAGAFPQTTVAAYSGPNSFTPGRLVSGDVDGDGHVDLLALDYGDEVAVLLGAGDGTFDELMPHISTNANDMVLADLDDDDRPDLVLMHYSSPNYEVLWQPGQGDGSFGVPQALAAGVVVGSFVPKLTVGDIDGDDDDDLVLAAGQQVLSYVNTAGSLGPVQVVDAVPAGRFLSPVLQDLDGDTDLDLVCAWTQAGIGSVSVWPGLGDGSFGTRIDRLLPDDVLGVMVSDLDVDGRPDLVCAGRRNVFVVRGGAGLGWLATVTYPQRGLLDAVRVGDLSGDGLPDLLLEAETGGCLRVAVGLGDGSFERLQALDGAAVAGDLADVTGDGRADVLLGFHDHAELRAALPGGGFGASLGGVASGVLTREVTFADLDHDGVLDLIGLDTAGPALGTALGTGGGSFSAPWSLALTGALSDLQVGDLDGDDVPDVVLRSNTIVRVLLGNGDGTLTQVAMPFTGATSGANLALGDLDGDELLDLAYTSGSALYTLLGQGDGSFAAAVMTTPVPSVSLADVALGSIDDDDFADMLVVANQVFVRLGSGDGAGFAELGALPGITGAAQARLSDVDGDGHVDAVVTRADGGLVVRYGDGTGAFDDRGEGPFALLAPAVDLAFGDTDGDGDLDLLSVHPANALSQPIGVDVLAHDQRRRWEQRGVGIAGAAGHATLGGIGTLEADTPVRVLLQSGLPGAPALLVLSLSALDFPTLGGVLVPAPDILLSGLPIDAGGVLDLGGTWPAGVPGDLQVFLQAWFADGSTTWGWAATPGLVMVTP